MFEVRTGGNVFPPTLESRPMILLSRTIHFNAAHRLHRRDRSDEWNRATYGAAMSRFEMAIQNLQISGENQAAARGRIVDADFAAETANMSRAQILQQAGTAMVAQANQLPQQVLSLLR